MATSQEAVRRLTIQTSAPGADQAAASLRGVSKAMEGVTVASTSTEKASLSLDQKFASLERRYVSQVRAQQDYEKTQRQVNAAVAQNPALQERANVILLAAKERHDQLTNSQKSMATVSAELNSRMQAAAGSFGAVGSALAALGPAGLAAAAALGLVAVGFKQAADAALALADRAGKLKDFSETTGFTVVQLQALEKAGAQVGVAAESVNRGLERFSVAMDDIKKGTGAAYESILEINPALAQQMKGVNSLTDAWDIFSRAIKAADLEQANKLARSVFGRSGVEITRLARASTDAGGTAGLVAGLKEVDRITAAQAERWDELGDKIAENTKAAKQNIASIFTEQVLTAMLSFSNAFLDLSRVAKEFKLSSELKFLLGVMATVAGGPVAIGSKIGTYVRGGGASAAANDNPTTPPRDFDDMFSDRSGGLNGSAGSLDTVRLEAQKRALSQVIAEQERWNAAMGAAVTPAQQLKLGIDKLKLAALENKISQEQSTRAQAALNAQYNSSQFSTYIGLLGQSASVEDQVQAKRNQINDATRQGVSLTKEQIATQIRLTQESALGITQINAQIDNEKVRAATMFMGAEAATAYAVAQSVINQHIQAGRKLSEDEIAQIKAKAAEYAKLKKQTDLYADTMADIKRGFEDVGKSMFTAFLSGKNVMDAMVQSLDRVADKLASSAFDNLLSGNPAQMGIGAVQAAASFAISMFTGDQKEKKALEEAKKKWEGMADQVTAFNNAAAGFNLGPMTQAIQSLFQTQLTLARAADEANDRAGVLQVQETFNSGVRRIVGEFVNANSALTPLEESIKAVNDEARGLTETLADYNLGSDPGIELSRLRQIAELQAEFFRTTEEGLRAEINSARGVGYVNEIADALKKFNDLAAQGVNGGLLQDWLSTIAQDVVDNAGLMGDAFQSLIAGFPQLIGMVHEASDVIKELRSAQDLARGSEGLVDRLFRATVDGDTLAGQLALFERAAMRERENEIRSGGELLTDLIAAQEAERFNLVRDFNQKAIDEQRRAAEEFQNFIAGITRRITEFLDSLRAGSSSPLSPSARLAAAQSQYGTQLGLAQGGDRDALGGITQYASDLLEAAKSFYGSTSGFQTIFSQIESQLAGLPAQVSAEQLIVDAIDAMRTSLLAAIQSNSPAAIGAALSGYFTQLDTSMNGAIDFNEMKAALGSSFSSGTWKTILDTLDTDGDGQINRLEAIKGYTNSTVAGIATSNAQLFYLTDINFKLSNLTTITSLLNTIATHTSSTAQQAANTVNVIGTTNSQLNRVINALNVQSNAWGVTTHTPLPAYAMGTNYAAGGMSLIGERGPEIMNVPRGAQIIPNHKINFNNDNSELVRELRELRASNARLERLIAIGVKVDGEGHAKTADAVERMPRGGKPRYVASRAA